MVHYSSNGQKNKHLGMREEKGNICDLTNQKTEVDLDRTKRTLHIAYPHHSIDLSTRHLDG